MKEQNIYITFPGNLVETDEKMYSYINQFIDHLRVVLHRFIQDKGKIYSKGKDFENNERSTYLKKSSKVIFFIHPDFSENEDYLDELQQACTHVALDGVNILNGFSGMFKLILEPLKAPLSIKCLEDLLPYDFFERNAFNRKVKSYDIGETTSNSSLYSKLLDLGFDISKSLEADSKSFKINGDKEKTVYLALTTLDQQQARDEIKRELLHYGFRVLPAINLPMNGEEFREIMLENLNHSSAVVQLMGASYGDLMRGTKHSMPDYQNLVIREYQQQAEGSDFQRYIWIPQNLKINDQRQSLYVKRIRRDDAGANTEFIESPLETFKTLLITRLTIADSVEKPEYENLSKVYILAEEDSDANLQQLSNMLSLSGLKVFTLNYDVQAGLYARHLQALRDCDGLIVYQRKENPYWLDSKLRDIIKAPGIGKTKAFKKVIISTNLEPDERLIKMIRSRVELLQPNGSDPEVILNKLISE